ncbi:ribosome maturation factor RimP [Sinomonas halotolerans]|uniref:Ribosome maturation factor RimP n=1 Tax=Sinomonas halotolerans TaxID=1644133 RepID=A0ABU9WVG0_9MICC
MSTPDLPQKGGPTQEHEAPAVNGEEGRLHALLEPAVHAHGLILEGVTLTQAGRHRVLHVAVDLPEDQEGGVGLDAIAEVSRDVSAALDADPAGDSRPYDLEVSSPGVSRPLTQPRHWRRARGRLVKVNVIQGENVTGRLTEVAESGIVVVPDLPAKKGVKPKKGEPVEVPFDRIRSGRVEVDFSHLDEVELGPETALEDEKTTEKNEEA